MHQTVLFPHSLCQKHMHGHDFPSILTPRVVRIYRQRCDAPNGTFCSLFPSKTRARTQFLVYFDGESCVYLSAALKCTKQYFLLTRSAKNTCKGMVFGPFRRPELGAPIGSVAMHQTILFPHSLRQIMCTGPILGPFRRRELRAPIGSVVVHKTIPTLPSVIANFAMWSMRQRAR